MIPATRGLLKEFQDWLACCCHGIHALFLAGGRVVFTLLSRLLFSTRACLKVALAQGRLALHGPLFGGPAAQQRAPFTAPRRQVLLVWGFGLTVTVPASYMWSKEESGMESPDLIF